MGRDDAFREFATARTPALLRSARLLCGEPHGAEDLVQDALVKVYLAWGRRRIDNPAAYAQTTLVRTYLSRQRRRSSSERPVPEVPDRGGAASQSEARLDLATALGRLSPTDRAVLVLRFLEDQTVAQTARALDLTEQAVRNRTHRALARVREHLGATYPVHTEHAGGVG